MFSEIDITQYVGLVLAWGPEPVADCFTDKYGKYLYYSGEFVSSIDCHAADPVCNGVVCGGCILNKLQIVFDNSRHLCRDTR